MIAVYPLSPPAGPIVMRNSLVSRMTGMFQAVAGGFGSVGGWKALQLFLPVRPKFSCLFAVIAVNE